MLERDTWSHGRPARLPGWDYAGDGCYFLTLVSEKRRPAFGTLISGNVQLSEIGRIVQQALGATPRRRKGVTVDTAVIMPDHLHAILFLERALPADDRAATVLHSLRRTPSSLGSLVAQFKAVTTHAARALDGVPERRLWQKGFYDRVVRNEKALTALRRYIVENPVRAAQQRRYDG